VTIGGLILAAGEGRRFGATKQLAELRGRPLLEYALEAMTAVTPRVVVLGHAAEDILAGVDLHGAAPVVCDDWASGQSASLRCGIAALPDCAAILVVLGDMPGVTAAAVRAVLAAAGTGDAVRATYDGRPAHPVVLGPALVERAGELRGDVGFRDLLDGADVHEVEVGGLADPTDIDSPKALAGVIVRDGASPAPNP
jgi:molybdenum cofactor cytidylyltransferase